MLPCKESECKNDCDNELASSEKALPAFPVEPPLSCAAPDAKSIFNVKLVYRSVKWYLDHRNDFKDLVPAATFPTGIRIDSALESMIEVQSKNAKVLLKLRSKLLFILEVFLYV
jgi:hypothetical protein